MVTKLQAWLIFLAFEGSTKCYKTDKRLNVKFSNLRSNFEVAYSGHVDVRP